MAALAALLVSLVTVRMGALKAASALLLCTVLAACAGTPVYTPHPAARWIDPQEVGYDTGVRPVEWGGTILEVRNLRHSTEIEVLAYPLDAGGRPDTDRSARGRFIVIRSGFLEPAEYAPGRELTAYGPLDGVREGSVGGAGYRYPILDAERLHLWPRGRDARRSNVHFGVGIGIGL